MVMPLSDSKQADVTRIYEIICRWGLQSPAQIVLEMGQPFSFVFAQCLWVAQPFWSWAQPSEQIGQFAHLLEDHQSVSALVDMLDVNVK